MPDRPALVAGLRLAALAVEMMVTGAASTGDVLSELTQDMPELRISERGQDYAACQRITAVTNWATSAVVSPTNELT